MKTHDEEQVSEEEEVEHPKYNITT